MAHGNELQKKRFFFLKLPIDWFKNARIKKMRRLAGGDCMTIIYLKLMLLSLNHECRLIYEGFEDTIAEELSYKIDEEVENIELTLAYLQANGLIEACEEGDISMTEAASMVGSETYGNILKKKQNERKQVGSFPTNVQPLSNPFPTENRDKSKSIEKEIDIEEMMNDSKRAGTHEENLNTILEGWGV